LKLEIQTLVGNLPHILSGSAAGRKLLATLIDATPPGNAPEKLFLDFTGIEVATASFLRESVIGFRDFTRSSRQNIYPIVTNAAPVVLEELELFVKARGDVLWCCSLNTQGEVSEHRILGDLDPVQHKTFAMVNTMGAATAPDLATRFTDETIGPTAWNNRLSGLVAKGLLVEMRQGKVKVFRPLLGDT
jgi:hypothetical protein